MQKVTFKIRQELRQAPGRRQREGLQDPLGDGRGAAPGHPRLQGEERLLPHRRSLGCFYRNLRTGRYGNPRNTTSSARGARMPTAT